MTHRNVVHDKIRRMKSRNACCYTVILPKAIKINTHTNNVLLVVSQGWGNVSSYFLE